MANSGLGGVIGKPIGTKKEKILAGAPIGTFAYWDKDAAAPEGHLTFTEAVSIARGVYPDLESVIPADAAGSVLAAHLANPAPAGDDQFGYSVAISGDYAIVGAYFDDPSGVTDAGSAYIYFRNGTAWSLQATLPNPAPAQDDNFGNSVAISGDYAIVGAFGDDPSGVTNAGSAYIYFRSGTTWSLQATLPNPEPAQNDRFGYSVAISGDYAIVGAFEDDPSGVTNAGSAYIYFRSGTTWSLQATLPNPAPAADDRFGFSVAISGDYAIVGAFEDDPSGVTNAGSAYIYFRSGTTWSLQATLPNPAPAQADRFGFSVAISGDYAIVGAYFDDPSGVTDAGSAYIYFRNGTNWSLQATLPNPAPAGSDQFGFSVAISGDFAIVGANLDDPSGVGNAGSAYIYFRSGTTWSLQATLPNPAPAADDRFGFSVAISGDYAIVGANLDDPSGVTNAGSAYIYVNLQAGVFLHPLPASAEHKTIVRVE